ncbi:MAG: porin [Methylococcales bacterium]
MKQFSLKKGLVLATALSAGLLTVGSAQAGATFKIDDTKWLSIGAGIRSSFSAVEAGAPEAGSQWSNDFALDNARIYLNGQVHENIKFEFNTESRHAPDANGVTTSDFFLLDAIAKFEFNDLVNIWVGRQLVPSDRAELNGPFYHSTYEFNKTPFFPNDQGSYTAGKYGRDDGINLWGALTADKKLTYVVGVFNGSTGGSDQDDHLLYAGRISYNFLNVEKNPGYYTSSTYYGNAGDILTVAFAAQYEQDGAGTEAQPADFTGYSVDLLGETTLGNGAVATVEAQYKRFELDGNDSGTGTLGMFEGDAYTGTALYLMPGKVGIGQLQPYVRFTTNEGEKTPDSSEYEAGLNYIIDGHNARISLMYQYGDIATKGRTYTVGNTGDDVHAIKVGFQMQI